MQAENILEMKSISKQYRGVKVLGSVDFSVRRGEVHCLAGENVAGKTALVKILTGDLLPDLGSIYFDGKELDFGTPDAKRGIATMDRETPLIDEFSIGENLFFNNYPKTKLGLIDWKTVYARTAELERKVRLNVDPKTKIGELDAGQRRLVEIMTALAQDAKLIIMDEPSAALSESEFEDLRNAIAEMKAQGITVLYISCRLKELLAVGDRVTVLRDGENAVTEELKNLNPKQLLALMTGQRDAFEETVLELRKLSGEKVGDFNLTLHRGEILGIYGPADSGAKEATAFLFGTEPHTEGQIFLNGCRFSPQDTYEAVKDKVGRQPKNRMPETVFFGIPISRNGPASTFARLLNLNVPEDNGDIQTGVDYIDRLQIAGENSDENRQKAIMTKWLLAEGGIFVADASAQEDAPAKLDVFSVAMDCAGEGKSVILTSTELKPLLEVCDRILTMQGGKVVGDAPAKDFDAQKIQNTALTENPENDKS